MAREKISRNAQLNRAVWEKMSACQRETGLTAAQLADLQHSLREQFYERRDRRARYIESIREQFRVLA